MLNTIRAKFIRDEEVKYISHLDLMQVFDRAFRRSHIPIAYSQGFNPHPHLVFGLPLSVGVTSQAEYGDFELTEEMDIKRFIESSNAELPKGLRIIDAKLKQSKVNIMASISASTYEILVSSNEKMGNTLINEKIKDFLLQPEIKVKKEGKRGIRDIDIRPMILKMEVKELKRELKESVSEDIFAQNCDNVLIAYIQGLSREGFLKPSFSLDNIFRISVLLSAGSVANLKPELLVSAFSQFLSNDKSELPEGIQEKALKLVKIHRTGLFIEKGNVLTDPLDDSVIK